MQVILIYSKKGVIMKRFISFIFVFILLSSCAVLPVKDDKKLLVIGKFELKFPDGYYNIKRPKTIKSGIILKVKNINTGEEFSIVSDKEGYYKILANAGEEYLFIKYVHENRINRTIYHSGQLLNVRFKVIDGKINYLGDVSIIYSKGSLAEDFDERKSYQYKLDFLLNDETQKLVEYLKDKKNGKIWLQDGIVTLVK